MWFFRVAVAGSVSGKYGHLRSVILCSSRCRRAICGIIVCFPAYSPPHVPSIWIPLHLFRALQCRLVHFPAHIPFWWIQLLFLFGSIRFYRFVLRFEFTRFIMYPQSYPHTVLASIWHCHVLFVAMYRIVSFETNVFLFESPWCPNILLLRVISHWLFMWDISSLPARSKWKWYSMWFCKSELVLKIPVILCLCNILEVLPQVYNIQSTRRHLVYEYCILCFLKSILHMAHLYFHRIRPVGILRFLRYLAIRRLVYILDICGIIHLYLVRFYSSCRRLWLFYAFS